MNKFDLNDIENMPDTVRFIFIAMSQAVIYIKKVDRDKEFFIKLAEECWDMCEKNGIEIMQFFLRNAMDKDMKDSMKGFKKNV